jgi:hypothetical protein
MATPQKIVWQLRERHFQGPKRYFFSDLEFDVDEFGIFEVEEDGSDIPMYVIARRIKTV